MSAQMVAHVVNPWPAGRGAARRSFARLPWGLVRPGHCISDVLLLEIEFGELGAHGVRTLDTHGREDDLAIPGFYLEIRGRPDRVGHRFG
jgi:hypothetical protein